jgi:hypothetical protein
LQAQFLKKNNRPFAYYTHTNNYLTGELIKWKAVQGSKSHPFVFMLKILKKKLRKKGMHAPAI